MAHVNVPDDEPPQHAPAPQEAGADKAAEETEGIEFPKSRFGRWWPIFFGCRVLLTGIISGGINAGIAVAYYKGEHDVKVWPLPHTLAGDAAVTIFIQCLIGWNLDGMLAFGDFQHRMMPPFPRVAALLRPWAVGRFFLNHSLQMLRGARDMDPEGRHPRTWRLRRFIGNVIRSLMLAVVIFGPLWGTLVGIAAGIWGRGDVSDTPGPQIFKGMEGLSLGIIGSSAVVMLVGAQCAEHGDGVNPHPATEAAKKGGCSCGSTFGDAENGGCPQCRAPDAESRRTDEADNSSASSGASTEPAMLSS